jgi:transcriptional regulator with XRE-family HTH domain
MTQMPYSADLEFDLLDRLQKSLRVSGKSRDQLAADLGVHRNTIGNYLNGKTPLDRRTLVAWSFSTGVPLEWLETGAGTSTTPPPDGPRADEAELNRLTARKRARARGDSVTRAYPMAA